MKVALKELEIKFVRRGPRLALNLREKLEREKRLRVSLSLCKFRDVRVADEVSMR